MLLIAKGTVLLKLDCPKNAIEVEEMKNIPYRNLLGYLAYIVNTTQPDIPHALNALSQFQEFHTSRNMLLRDTVKTAQLCDDHKKL